MRLVACFVHAHLMNIAWSGCYARVLNENKSMTFPNNLSSEKIPKMAVEEKTNMDTATAKPPEKEKKKVQKQELGHNNQKEETTEKNERRNR